MTIPTPEMNSDDMVAFKHFIAAYKDQWDLNDYYRKQYDDDLEYYLGYRDASQYPMDFNMTFNKLLPRVMTVLSRMMDQIYQSPSHNIVSARPRKRADVPRAPRAEGLINFQLENLNSIDQPGGSYAFNFQWMFNAVTWGKGISKLYWRKEERITPQRISMPIPVTDNYGNVIDIDVQPVLITAPQIAYDGPYAEVLHNKNFVPHPYYKNIQEMPFVFCVYTRSVDYLKRMADRGVFRNVDKLGGNDKIRPPFSMSETHASAERYAKSIGIDGVVSTEELRSDRMAPEVDVVEGYGKYIFPEDEVPYEIGSGLQIKGYESEAIVHIGNYKTILSIQKNEYGSRPFFSIGGYHHPELFWDLGLIKLGKAVQEQVNNLGNTRYQNALMLVNQMLKVRMDADIDPEYLIWKPFGVVPVEEMGDVEPLVVPDASQTGAFREQEQFFEEVLEDITGMYRYNMGSTPERQEHVGTIYSLQSMGEARTKLLLMTMDYQGFQPFLRHMMTLNTWHLPMEFEARVLGMNGEEEYTPIFPEDVHPEYDFSMRYTAMEPALGKQFRAQQLIQYAQMWAETPYLQQHQFMKSILELLDFKDPEKYLYTEEQVQQQQMQQMQQMVAAEMMQHQLRESEADNQFQRDSAESIIKGLLS